MSGCISKFLNHKCTQRRVKSISAVFSECTYNIVDFKEHSIPKIAFLVCLLHSIPVLVCYEFGLRVFFSSSNSCFACMLGTNKTFIDITFCNKSKKL